MWLKKKTLKFETWKLLRGFYQREFFLVILVLCLDSVFKNLPGHNQIVKLVFFFLKDLHENFQDSILILLLLWRISGSLLSSHLEETQSDFDTFDQIVKQKNFVIERERERERFRPLGFKSDFKTSILMRLRRQVWHAKFNGPLMGWDLNSTYPIRMVLYNLYQ